MVYQVINNSLPIISVNVDENGNLTYYKSTKEEVWGGSIMNDEYKEIEECDPTRVCRIYYKPIGIKSQDDWDILANIPRELDLNKFVNAYSINLNSIPFTKIHITGCKALRCIDLEKSAIRDLRLSNLPVLRHIALSRTVIDAFLIENCPSWEELWYEFTGINKLVVRNCPNIKKIKIHSVENIDIDNS